MLANHPNVLGGGTAGISQASADARYVINGTNPGAVTITAGGANQNITLTPSGTGASVLDSRNVSDVRIGVNETNFTGDRKTLTYSSGGFAEPGGFNVSSNGDKVTWYSNGSDYDSRIGVGTAANLWIKSLGSGGAEGKIDFYAGTGVVTPIARMISSALLLGTTTDSSNGRLQVAGGQIACAASTTGYASILLPHGTAPSSPVDGQMWTTTAGLFVRINGATVGPLS